MWMLDAIHDPILIVGADGRVEHLNRAARATLPSLKSGAPLVDETTSNVDAFLSRCRGSARQLPGSLAFRVEGDEATFRCLGSRLIPDRNKDERVLIRLLPERDERFAYLSNRLQALDRELRARNAMLVKLEAEVAARIQAERERDHLLSRLYQVHLQERKQIARELHDQIGQHVVSLKLGLHRLLGELEDGELRASIAGLQKQADSIGADLRRVVNELRPSGLAEFGLAAALRNLVEDVSAAAAMEIDFRVVGEGALLSSEAEVTLFRVVQESLTNILKHAGPTGLVAVTLQYREAAAVVTVEDDGRGFDPTSAVAASIVSQGSFGLCGIRERVALVGGECEIESSPGHGTTISARIPTKEETP